MIVSRGSCNMAGPRAKYGNLSVIWRSMPSGYRPASV
jgi:hypothetical protein